MMDKPQDAQLMADKAQEALWNALRSGRLRDGQFLSMSQLVETLEFPISAIREAVKHANSLGLLITLPKRGVQIMEARPETIRECLDFRMVFDQEGARRRIISEHLSDLRGLRERHEAMRDNARSNADRSMPPMAIEVDLSLHNYLADGLENSQLAAAYSANRMRIAIIQNARPFLQDRIVSAMEEHLAIIEALEHRDAESAIRAIGYHCEQTMRWWGVA